MFGGNDASLEAFLDGGNVWLGNAYWHSNGFGTLILTVGIVAWVPMVMTLDAILGFNGTLILYENNHGSCVVSVLFIVLQLCMISIDFLNVLFNIPLCTWNEILLTLFLLHIEHGFDYASVCAIISSYDDLIPQGIDAAGSFTSDPSATGSIFNDTVDILMKPQARKAAATKTMKIFTVDVTREAVTSAANIYYIMDKVVVQNQFYVNQQELQLILKQLVVFLNSLVFIYVLVLLVVVLCCVM